MLAHLLAIAVAGGSLSFYLALFIVPQVYRHKSDFAWCGVGLFYALVLWICSGRLTGGVLLGQTASVALLGWLGWQTVSLRRSTPMTQPATLPKTLTNNPVGKLLQRFRKPAVAVDSQESETTPEVPAEAPAPTASPEATTEAAAPTASSPDPAPAEPVELSDLAPDTPELAEVAPEDVAAPTASPASASPDEVAESDALTEEVATEQAESPAIAAPTEQETSDTPTPEPTPTRPAPPPEDLSGIPEPSVISGLQDLENFEDPEEPETQKAEPEAQPAAGEPVPSLTDPIDLSDVSLDDSLWEAEEQKPTAKEPEKVQSQASESPKQEPSTTPPKASPETIEEEISTSFADRIVEANFNPDEEDIVDVEVIRSSTDAE